MLRRLAVLNCMVSPDVASAFAAPSNLDCTDLLTPEDGPLDLPGSDRVHESQLN